MSGDGDHAALWQKTQAEPNSGLTANLAGLIKVLDSTGLEVYNVAIPMHSLGLVTGLPQIKCTANQ